MSAPNGSAGAQPLTMNQGFALLFEQESARQLLAHGVHVLAGADYSGTVLDPVLTVWSIGVEKLLKVAVGLGMVGDDHAWPDMKKLYSHNLVKLDADLRVRVHRWLDTQQEVESVAGLVRRVDDDPVWPVLLDCLHLYANEGRFHRLDELAQARADRQDPKGLWGTVETAVLEADTEFADRFYATITNGPIDDHRAAARELHGFIAGSMVGWWFMVTRAARFGALGETGRQFGADSEPANALPEVHFDDETGQLLR